MMQRLISGQKVALTDVSYRLQIDISSWQWGVIVLKAGHSAILSSDDLGLTRDGNQLMVDFQSLDSSIERIVIFIHTNASDELNTEALSTTLYPGSSDQAQFNILLEQQSRSERALNLLEMYQHKGKWKVSCVCQGFVEGLDRLLGLYKLNRPVSHSLNKPAPQRTKPAVNNGKGSIEMSWDMAEESQHSPQKLYVGSQFNVISDFRIGCFYQLRNGQVGLAHSIEKSESGSFIGVPYIEASRELDKHFEQLKINLQYQHKLHRYLIFAFMVEGYGYWKAHNIKINVQVDGVEPTILTPDSLMVKPVHAVAMLEFDQGNTELTPLNEYFENLPSMDQAYGWGLQWRQTQ
ncbi:TerD family protein [Leucothrix arctica]|uniref:TerD domain-containing protein n=1 Tax=Leucothrix arctica TaxID=1481894 RepID=A0A317CQ80_9GAMM|nr:TerD family protein [Leucothrix arctica]PWQ98560.1 hypothetical protein DKT75_03660 [Leucothrix arctica]